MIFRLFFELSLFLIVSSSVYAARLTAIQNFDFGTWSFGGRYGFVTLTRSGTTSNVFGLDPIQSQTIISNGIIRYDHERTDDDDEELEIRLLQRYVVLKNAQGRRVFLSQLTPTNKINVDLSGRYGNISLGATVYVLGWASGVYTGTVPIRVINSRGEVADIQLSATISFMKGLSLSEVQDLNFGEIEISGAGSGIVRLNPQTQIRQIVSGNQMSLLATSSAGSFLLQGEPNTNLSITYPDSIFLTAPSGEKMSVNNFAIFPSAPILDSQGQVRLFVGADLIIQKNQKSGSYAGNYYIDISY